MPSISARNISVSTAPAPDSAAKPCHYAECAAAAGVVTTAGLVEKSLSQLWRPFASLANVLGMANSFRSWWPRRWRVLNSWRARVIAAIVFCTTLIAGTAALIKNIQIIKEFVGIGKRQLRALRSMPEQQILSLTQTQMLNTSWLSSQSGNPVPRLFTVANLKAGWAILELVSITCRMSLRLVCRPVILHRKWLSGCFVRIT
jgi:hypothetical protein